MFNALRKPLPCQIEDRIYFGLKCNKNSLPDYTINKKHGSMKNEEKQERTFTLISLTYLYKNANNQKTKKTSYQ